MTIVEPRTILMKGGTAAQWLQNDDVLQLREVGLLIPDSGPPVLKVGDGVTKFSQLPAIASGGGGGGSGTTPNVQAGNTTTGNPGTSASVTRRAGSTDAAPVFDFVIPRGDTGTPGTQGVPGTAGTTPAVAAGTTTTGAAGSSAAVTRRANSPDAAPVFDFTIPRGDTGTQGIQGIPGNTGSQGPSGDTAAYVAGGTLAASSSTALLATGPRTTSYTINGAVTFTLANGTSGQSYTHTLLLVQGSAGSATVTWPSGVRWHKGVKPTLSTAAGAYDVIHLLWTGVFWAGFVGGLAIA